MSKSAFQFKKPEDSPGFLLWQVSINWQRKIKVTLDKYKISHAQFVILALLYWCEENKITPNQIFLVNKTKLDKMTVSQALKKLVSIELVKRKECSEDTRAKVVVLTAKGQKLILEIIPKIEQADAEYFANINKSEHNDLISIFRKITTN